MLWVTMPKRAASPAATNTVRPAPPSEREGCAAVRVVPGVASDVEHSIGDVREMNGSMRLPACCNCARMSAALVTTRTIIGFPAGTRAGRWNGTDPVDQQLRCGADDLDLPGAKVRVGGTSALRSSSPAEVRE